MMNVAVSSDLMLEAVLWEFIGAALTLMMTGDSGLQSTRYGFGFLPRVSRCFQLTKKSLDRCV